MWCVTLAAVIGSTQTSMLMARWAMSALQLYWVSCPPPPYLPSLMEGMLKSSRYVAWRRCHWEVGPYSVQPAPSKRYFTSSSSWPHTHTHTLHRFFYPYKEWFLFLIQCSMNQATRLYVEQKKEKCVLCVYVCTWANTFLFIQRRGRMYNADLQVHTIRHAMLEQLRNPPAGQVTCCTQWLSTHLVATLFRITSMCTRYKHSLTCLWIKSLRWPY